MAISTINDYVGAKKQQICLLKNSMTSVAFMWTNPIAQTGNLGAGVLAGTNTANGVVPTDATAGTPIINTNTGTYYITRHNFTNTVVCRMQVFDMLFKAGAYTFNANTTLASQPSYSSRVPGGTDYKDTQIWIEAVTAFTGNQTITVTYTNQDGTTGRTTGAVATGVAPIIGRMLMLPLQSGDTGVQKIESVVSTVSTVGTFNVLVLRPLTDIVRVPMAGFADTFGWDKTGMVQIFPDSAILPLVCPDSTTTGISYNAIEIASA